jgi:CheY-like chemotaxis protein
MGTQNGTPLHILIVDDHHDTVTAVRRLLMRDGQRVTPAESCDEAVAAAKAVRFDVVLADIGMPEKDGFALLKELRALYPLRAVALTGYGMPEEVSRIMAAGFDAHLLKPIEFSCLRAVLDSLPPLEDPSSLTQEQLIAQSLQRLDQSNALRDTFVDQLARNNPLRQQCLR